MTSFPDTPSLAAAIQSERFSLRLPGRPEWIAPVAGLLQQRIAQWELCAEDKALRVGLVLQEALTNAVVHGCLGLAGRPGRTVEALHAEAQAAAARGPARFVDVYTFYDGQRCQWVIADQGEGFDFEAVLRGQVASAGQGSAARGRGILFMRTIADELRYEEGGRRLVLTVRKDLPGLPRSLHIAFENPIEVFPVRSDGVIEYDRAYKAVCHVLTESGLGLLQRHPLPPRCLVIGIRCQPRVFFLPAVLVQSHDLGDGYFALECQFPSRFTPGSHAPRLDELFRDSRLIADTVEEILQNAAVVGPPEHERRQYRRIYFREPVQLVGTGRPCYALNLSKGGIGLVSLVPLEPEQVCWLHLPQPQGPPLQARIRIHRCTPLIKGFHEVAAQFLTVESAPLPEPPAQEKSS